MAQIKFTSLRGTELVAEKYDEQRIKMGRKFVMLKIVQKCGKRYAILDGVSVYEEKNDPETWDGFFKAISEL